MFFKSAEALEKIMEIFESYKKVSNLTISKENTKIAPVGKNINEEINLLRRININEQAIRKELKFLGHIINLSHLSNDKLNTNMISAKLKKML